MNHLREDRFFCSIPFVTQETFRNSSFLQLYDETSRHPARSTVIASLRNAQGGNKQYYRIIRHIEMAPGEHDVIRTYTSNIDVGEQTFYNYINDKLCSDDPRTLRDLMPLVRRATYQINRNAPRHNCTAYRGVNLTNTQRVYFTVGTIFRFPGFTSTSKSKSQAEIFVLGITTTFLSIMRFTLAFKSAIDRLCQSPFTRSSIDASNMAVKNKRNFIT